MCSGSACLVGFRRNIGCGFPGGIPSRSPADCRMMLSRCAADSRRQLSRLPADVRMITPSRLAAFVCCVRSAFGRSFRPSVYRIMRMRLGVHHADAAFPAWDGGRWSDEKRRSARKNLSKHATHSKKKILKKNDADLKLSIFQTGDFIFQILKMKKSGAIVRVCVCEAHLSNLGIKPISASVLPSSRLRFDSIAIPTGRCHCLCSRNLSFQGRIHDKRNQGGRQMPIPAPPL